MHWVPSWPRWLLPFLLLPLRSWCSALPPAESAYVSVKRPGFVHCAGEALYIGPSAGKEDCESKCSASPGCGFYSLWSGKRSSNWCHLTRSCNAFKTDVHAEAIYVFRKLADGEELGNLTALEEFFIKGEEDAENWVIRVEKEMKAQEAKAKKEMVEKEHQAAGEQRKAKAKADKERQAMESERKAKDRADKEQLQMDMWVAKAKEDTYKASQEASSDPEQAKAMEAELEERHAAERAAKQEAIFQQQLLEKAQKDRDAALRKEREEEEKERRQEEAEARKQREAQRHAERMVKVQEDHERLEKMKARATRIAQRVADTMSKWDEKWQAKKEQAKKEQLMANSTKEKPKKLRVPAWKSGKKPLQKHGSLEDAGKPWKAANSTGHQNHEEAAKIAQRLIESATAAHTPLEALESAGALEAEVADVSTALQKPLKTSLALQKAHFDEQHRALKAQEEKQRAEERAARRAEFASRAAAASEREAARAAEKEARAAEEEASAAEKAASTEAQGGSRSMQRENSSPEDELLVAEREARQKADRERKVRAKQELKAREAWRKEHFGKELEEREEKRLRLKSNLEAASLDAMLDS